ncbi:nitroreductase [Xanthobacter sp. DSM 24535]|uniref:nitroreductase n=1 Tax=Roseixanthobacter psychrophilus TaxID=3119917 RepID=UPI00372886C7
MNVAALEAMSPAEVTLAYHARTKHTLPRYAPGPETLDWDSQPDPFRTFADAPRILLPLGAHLLATRFGEIYGTPPAPAELDLQGLALLLELSFGLAAWKELGPDRWALRCNPSSGNLHPTEVYALTANMPGLCDGLHHYVSRDHTLEQRCRVTALPGARQGLWIGLSSIHWREAWKYGERAFRYCQLDIGHALGALRYAAGALGWTARVVECDAATLTALMGLDRAGDFSGVESEDGDVLVAIEPGTGAGLPAAAPCDLGLAQGEWGGRASLLDRRPLYRWPVIPEVARATRASGKPFHRSVAQKALPALTHEHEARAADILLGRRSAQRFDSRFELPLTVFYRLLDALLPRAAAPWDLFEPGASLHPVFFVHRVAGLTSGLYALPRSAEGGKALRTALRSDFTWEPVGGAPTHLPLVRLVERDCRGVARTVSCHQAIASDGCFSLSMLAEFEHAVRADPSCYRQLHWEAGLLGHVLYLEAEAAGVRGTGIGCFFDDPVHDLLGLTGLRFQALYHFTVGRPLGDDRITTAPAYPGRPLIPARE